MLSYSSSSYKNRYLQAGISLCADFSTEHLYCRRRYDQSEGSATSQARVYEISKYSNLAQDFCGRDFKISREISGFPKISGKISRFYQRFQDFRDFWQGFKGFQLKCTRFQKDVADPSDQPPSNRIASRSHAFSIRAREKAWYTAYKPVVLCCRNSWNTNQIAGFLHMTFFPPTLYVKRRGYLHGHTDKSYLTLRFSQSTQLCHGYGQSYTLPWVWRGTGT